MKIAVQVVDILDFAAPVLVFVDFVDKQVLSADFAELVGCINKGVVGEVTCIG